MSKMKKALAVLLSALMVCVFAAGCGQQEEAEGVEQTSGTGGYRIGIIQYNEQQELCEPGYGPCPWHCDSGGAVHCR